MAWQVGDDPDLTELDRDLQACSLHRGRPLSDGARLAVLTVWKQQTPESWVAAADVQLAPTLTLIGALLHRTRYDDLTGAEIPGRREIAEAVTYAADHGDSAFPAHVVRGKELT
ncbi:hypothetical protein [Agromyces humi]|uniref:hypothetical protein n=1 Tax=Agromyces humi TaxID=1766800 RepID=UPI001357ACAF|nr:hypothetical protein [Agromyces humi]